MFSVAPAAAFKAVTAIQAPPPNGFTLMELLIVMAIIAILMLIAIPTVGSLKKKANDLSAINSVQTITKAELQYSDTIRPMASPAR